MRWLVAFTVSLSACGSPARPGPVALPPTPARTTIALPGPCVDPLLDAVRRLGPDADREGARVERTLDLDGDGTLDPMITHGSFCGTGGCDWHLYVARGDCGHHVGEVFGLLPTARSDATSGLVDLEITARDGCGGMARTETRVRFVGSAYTPAETRKCLCPEPTEEPASAADLEDPERWCEPWRPVGDGE